MSSLFNSLFSTTSGAKTANTQTSDQQQANETKVNGSTNQNTTENNNSNTSGSQTSSTTNNQAAQGTSVTSTLSPEVQSVLNALVPTLAGNVSGGETSGNAAALNNVASTLFQKAQTPAVSAADIAGEESAAKTAFQQGEAVTIGQEQQQIGSTGNTYSQLLAAKGNQDLASTLAGIVANAKLQNAQISTQDLNSAVQALTAGTGASASTVQQLMQLISGLSGATTVTNTGQTISGTQTGQQTNQSSTQDVINTIQQILTNTDTQQSGEAQVNSGSNTTGSQTTTPGLLTSLFG